MHPEPFALGHFAGPSFYFRDIMHQGPFVCGHFASRHFRARTSAFRHFVARHFTSGIFSSRSFCGGSLCGRTFCGRLFCRRTLCGRTFRRRTLCGRTFLHPDLLKIPLSTPPPPPPEGDALGLHGYDHHTFRAKISRVCVHPLAPPAVVPGGGRGGHIVSSCSVVMRVGVGGEGGNQTAANCHSPSASSFLWGKSFF